MTIERKDEYESREDRISWEIKYLEERTKKLYDFVTLMLNEFDEEFEEFSDGSKRDLSNVRMELEEIESVLNKMSMDANEGDISRKKFRKVKEGFNQVKTDFEDVIDDTRKALGFEFNAIQEDLEHIFHENNEMHQ